MSDQQKVLILGKLPPPNMGPAIATKILLNSSLKDHFLLLHLDTRINKSLSSMGKWNTRKVFRNIAIYGNLLRLCLVERPALVLIPISQSTTGFLKDFGFIFICRMTGRRILLQLRGSNFRNWLQSTAGWVQSLVKRAMRWSEGMIVLGSKLKYLFADYFPDDKIFVIPNGGNFHFEPGTRDSAIVRFLFLSNLFDAKGIRDVIEAVGHLKKTSQKEFCLDVAGAWLEEDTKEFCVSLVEKNMLPVTFYPAVGGDEKMKLFGRADVFIFTPREPEGHPWVIVEAMASALPIIATDQGAITESVHDKENGYIVTPRNPGEIADRMNKLLEDAALRKSMGAQSLALYRAEFTEEKMAAKYEACFQTIIAKGSHG